MSDYQITEPYEQTSNKRTYNDISQESTNDEHQHKKNACNCNYEIMTTLDVGENRLPIDIIFNNINKTKYNNIRLICHSFQHFINNHIGINVPIVINGTSLINFIVKRKCDTCYYLELKITDTNYRNRIQQKIKIIKDILIDLLSKYQIQKQLYIL
jgi:hypothetical protein